MGFSGKGALGGAGTGAAMGATLGPYGAAVGAVAGALLGGLFGGGGKSKEQVRQEQLAAAQRMFGKPNELNFRLQGADERRSRLLERASFVSGRGIGQADPVKQSQFRQDQEKLIEALRRQARGEGPSLAAEQARQVSNRAVANQLALARSGGGNAGLAARAAAQNAAALQGSVAGQAALGRAQEQLGAVGQLGQAIGQGRSQDRAFQELQQRGQLENLGLQLRNRGQNDQALQELFRQELANAQAAMQGRLARENTRQNLINAFLGEQVPQQPTTGDALLGAAASSLPLLLQRNQNKQGGDDGGNTGTGA